MKLNLFLYANPIKFLALAPNRPLNVRSFLFLNYFLQSLALLVIVHTTAFYSEIVHARNVYIY
jgi:hypothetical protein